MEYEPKVMRINLHQCDHEYLDDEGNRAHRLPVYKDLARPAEDASEEEWREYMLHWEVCDCGQSDLDGIRLEDDGLYHCCGCGEATCDVETLNRIRLEMDHPAFA